MIHYKIILCLLQTTFTYSIIIVFIGIMAIIVQQPETTVCVREYEMRFRYSNIAINFYYYFSLLCRLSFLPFFFIFGSSCNLWLYKFYITKHKIYSGLKTKYTIYIKYKNFYSSSNEYEKKIRSRNQKNRIHFLIHRLFLFFSLTIQHSLR